MGLTAEEKRQRHNAYMREYTRKNKEKLRAKNQAWYVRTRATRSIYERARAHGITLEQYNSLIEKQKGLCAACKQIPAPTKFCKTGFNIDHDHACCPGPKSCGKCIRGLLCSACNNGLGCFKDNPTLLRQGATYLEEWQ